ncbi:STAS domain-containing protein [Rubrivivax sp. A210]|uniref:STAS domain-containing protein n=1 Tax=Rubrivivax sp. A210 TaxID=2772301 RepID=UPI00191B5ED4|nr:STAS domain-containing protein [Rubrivivax sp. A210]CAD5372607.1 STAS domain-containing protein [Rubrivivax sp. A210]
MSSLQLPASATLEQAAALAETLPEAVASGTGVLSVDASALQAFDTSTIALLMQARRLAGAAGRGFELVGAPAKLAELARLYGVEELLSLSSSSRAPGA